MCCRIVVALPKHSLVFLTLIRKCFLDKSDGEAQRGAIINLISNKESIVANTPSSGHDPHSIGYQMSRAAIREMTKILGVALKELDVIVASVGVDMGEKDEEAVAELVKAIGSIDMQHSAAYCDHRGEKIEKKRAHQPGQSHRRTWNTYEYSLKASERAALEKEAEEGIKPKTARELLQARDYRVDLESKVGKSVVINTTAPNCDAGGYYCNVCDCVIKDCINFLDHINGKNHQKNMGMSMKVKRSTLDDVKARFAFKKKEQVSQKREEQIKEALEEIQEEEARMVDYKQGKRKERKRYARARAVSTPEMAESMGFGGFGSPKKK
ncbi:unnamed protein product, partial [Mesorhabditis spiculigera]